MKARIRFLLVLVALSRFVSAQKTDYPHPTGDSVMAATYEPSIQLLNDTAFNNGFRAYWSCSHFDGDDSLTVGTCLEYYTPYANGYTAPYGNTFAVHSWPDAGPPNDTMVNTIPNSYFSDAGYNIGFSLRRKDNPYSVVFLGYSPYGVHTDYVSPPEYEESFGADQFGQALYRGAVADLGGPIAPDGNPRNITIELRALMDKAVSKAAG